MSYDTKQIFLKEAVKTIRQRKIKGAKDAVEEAWNMEMERLAHSMILLAWPDQAEREFNVPDDERISAFSP